MSDTLNRFHILNETCANKKASQVWASALQKLEVARLSPRLGEEGFWVHGLGTTGRRALGLRV